MTEFQPTFGHRQAMPLDDAMRRVEEMNLDQLERLIDPDGKLQVDQVLADVAPFAFALSQGREGRAFFEWLCDMTVRRPIFVRGMGMEEAALYAAMREGQNAVVYMILKAMKLGEEKLNR